MRATKLNVYQKLREQSGYSQSEFALKVGISVKNWQNWEQGVCEPHPFSKETILARAKRVKCKRKPKSP